LSTTPLAEVRNVRLEKAARLRELGINPYPSKSGRTRYVGPLVAEFEAREGEPVVVAGRLMSWRKQGGLSFGHVQDQTGRIQLFIRRQQLAPTDPARATIGYEDLNLIDVGDIVEAAGTLNRTQRGEISVFVDSLRLLTKALRPLPDKWSGLTDRETILRKRYLDAIMSQESRTRFEQVARMLYAAREYLKARGFLEFQTPVIQPQYGGGTARPFITHVNALDADMYLAISHELYLKRLIAAGYDKVFTIGRYFRNEGIDRSHQPEFSMIETMTAYENYEYNMELVQELFRYVGEEAFGRTRFEVRGHTIDFSRPWERVSMVEAVRRATGIDFGAVETVEEANARLAELGLRERQESVGHALVAAFEERVGETLVQPTLVYGHPVEISPLAKPVESDPRYAERFEIFIAGMECGDNWSEQNDPAELLARWRQSYRPEDRDSGEFHPLDYDFIEALEYGIPPTTGIGPGLERMAMIFTGHENIDDVVFFPMMKPVVSEVNKIIYGIEERRFGPPAGDDLVVSPEEFESLLREGVLRPDEERITIQPHVRIWSPPEGADLWRATSHFAVEGFLGNRPVRVTAPTVTAREPLDVDARAKALVRTAEERLLPLVRELHPRCKAEIRHVIRVSDPPGEV
jgi:lysyl-tRNA synthetase, class II